MKIADKYRRKFVKASPFPHIVIDNFIPEDMLDIVEREFPKIDDIAWTLWGPGKTKNTRNVNVEKVGTSNEEYFGPFTRHFMSQLNSSTFIHFLESLTQTSDIIVDPSYNDCGLHSTGPGGKLMIHTDSNRHPVKKGNLIHQRFNLILFINKDWPEEYGGHLELWSRDKSKCEQRILPIFNRCVIFDTGKYSFHGHPWPVTCPEGRRRNSLAVYYYVLDRPTNAGYSGIQPEVTWVETTPEEKQWKATNKKTTGAKKKKSSAGKLLAPFSRFIDRYFRK